MDRCVPLGRAVLFSNHALQRMAERNIMPNEVFALLVENEERVHGSPKFTMKRGGTMVTVACKMSVDVIHVTTVYEDQITQGLDYGR